MIALFFDSAGAVMALATLLEIAIAMVGGG
jgi:hypothetical protein